jgi:hypothetical protein
MAFFFRNTLYIEPGFVKFGTVTLIFAQIFNMEFGGNYIRVCQGGGWHSTKNTLCSTFMEETVAS